VRAWIVRNLVRSLELRVKSDGCLMTIFEIQKRFPDRDDIDSIVADMIKEGIVEVEN
jgi:hypothetical protein